MESETIDIESDFDHRIDEAVFDWLGDLSDYHGFSEAEAEAEVADVLERFLDDRCASDWF